MIAQQFLIAFERFLHEHPEARALPIGTEDGEAGVLLEITTIEMRNPEGAGEWARKEGFHTGTAVILG